MLRRSPSLMFYSWYQSNIAAANCVIFDFDRMVFLGHEDLKMIFKVIQLLILTLIPTVIDLKNTSYLLYIKIQEYPEPYIKRKCHTVKINLIYVLWLFQQLVLSPRFFYSGEDHRRLL